MNKQQEFRKQTEEAKLEAFSLMCRKVADLEKENAELKEINTHTLSQLNLDNGELIIENEKLKKENAELKKLFADCDTCKRTCDIGNCCKFGSDYLPDVEKVLNEQKQLTKAKKILKKFMPYVIESYLKQDISNIKLSFSEIEEAEQFLKEVEK